MKVSKFLMLSMIAMPFMVKACDPMEPNCGLVVRHTLEKINPALLKERQQENRIETQIAKSYPLVEQERAIQQQYADNGYASKDFKAYNAQLTKVISQPAYKKQLDAFNKAVAKKMSDYSSSHTPHTFSKSEWALISKSQPA